MKASLPTTSPTTSLAHRSLGCPASVLIGAFYPNWVEHRVVDPVAVGQSPESAIREVVGDQSKFGKIDMTIGFMQRWPIYIRAGYGVGRGVVAPCGQVYLPASRSELRRHCLSLHVRGEGNILLGYWRPKKA